MSNNQEMILDGQRIGLSTFLRDTAHLAHIRDLFLSTHTSTQKKVKCSNYFTPTTAIRKLPPSLPGDPSATEEDTAAPTVEPERETTMCGLEQLLTAAIPRSVPSLWHTMVVEAMDLMTPPTLMHIALSLLPLKKIAEKLKDVRDERYVAVPTALAQMASRPTPLGSSAIEQEMAGSDGDSALPHLLCPDYEGNERR